LCETFDDARRIAYLTMARAQTCELIVRDAYNRIIEHERIEGHRAKPTGPRSRGPRAAGS